MRLLRWWRTSRLRRPSLDVIADYIERRILGRLFSLLDVVSNRPRAFRRRGVPHKFAAVLIHPRRGRTGDCGVRRITWGS